MNLIQNIIIKILFYFIKSKEKIWNANSTNYHIR